MTGLIFPKPGTWEADRVGMQTSSKISVLLVDGKSESGLGQGALTYILEKVCETITGGVWCFQVPSTEWGNTWEPVAVERLTELYPALVHYGKKFFKFTDWSGGSPDAVHIANGVNKTFELKCPEKPEQHAEHCLIESQEQLAKEYKAHYAQLQMNMMIMADANEVPRSEMMGAFVSFHPYFQPRENSDDVDMSLFILHIKPDLELQQKIEEKIQVATAEMKRMIKKIESRFTKTLV